MDKCDTHAHILKMECIYKYVCVCEMYIGVCTMEYYSSIKRKEILLFATSWMDLEDLLLSKVRWTENTVDRVSRTNTVYFHSYVES